MEYLKHPGRLEALIPTNTKHKQSGADPLSQWTVRRRPPLLCPARARRRTRPALRGRADRVHFKLAHVVYAPRPTTRQLTCQNQSAHETWPQCNLSRCHDRLSPQTCSLSLIRSILSKFRLLRTSVYYKMRSWGRGPFQLCCSKILNIYQRLIICKTLG